MTDTHAHIKIQQYTFQHRVYFSLTFMQCLFFLVVVVVSIATAITAAFSPDAQYYLHNSKKMYIIVFDGKKKYVPHHTQIQSNFKCI